MFMRIFKPSIILHFVFFNLLVGNYFDLGLFEMMIIYVGGKLLLTN